MKIGGGLLKNVPNQSTNMADNTNIQKTPIDGLYIVGRPIYRDNRGFFREIYQSQELKEFAGVNFNPVQFNHSLSLPKVMRGVHAENWNKLAYPTNGKVFVAIADIRPDSPTFAKVETFIIDDENRHGLFVSKGLANSICNMGNDPVNYVYIVDAYYDGTDTRAIAWDDPDLKIDWPIKDPIISDRDKANPKLRGMFPEKFK